ncbi:hypothetical protein OG594_08705 [Streptomyces sp. NBC_01214]|uniref:hypothetical protein n=1 Tax=Streptomyces sp. NBC_01214 TaxID=2903777 RepID=UPI0022574D53|nr:hypothetical protein [Streptomyces sp. NBC_01214]MCX4801729.1 hypothetical protein [Streptomyces sp. NBC_01214]
MTSTTRNFLGIPVEGDITEGSTRVEQKPIEEFQPTLQAMLDDPTIVEFGWRQYTPYFNDGEPCEFSAYGTWVRTTDDKDVEDDYELEVDSHRTLGKRPYRRQPDGEYAVQPYEGPDEARYDRCRALGGAVEGGRFETVLLAAFGDHAAVTVRRDGIQVDFYEHD